MNYSPIPGNVFIENIREYEGWPSNLGMPYIYKQSKTKIKNLILTHSWMAFHDIRTLSIRGRMAMRPLLSFTTLSHRVAGGLTAWKFHEREQK